MKTILFVALALYSGFVNAGDLSAQATLGKCSSSVYMQMCGDDRNVWRVSGQARHQLADNVNLVAELVHFSSWDGSADINGDTENQTGKVDYVGIGVEYVNGPFRFGWNAGQARDPVGLFDGGTHHIYASLEQPLTDSLSVTIIADTIGEFSYTGVGLNWKF